jgi:pimeloyl-ACP methyl ester carboxylesterase
VPAVQSRILDHEQAGDGDPAVVLLPGGLTGWQTWEPFMPILARAHRAVRLQPITNAEGIAGRVGDGTYDAEIERESIDLTLEEAGVDDMHLVGWSNGGRMALDFALAQPERIRTLTLIDPAAWWLVEETDPSARSFDAFAADCAGRELDEDDLERFLVDVGVAGPETDFRSLEAWSMWSSYRQCLSWFDERTLRSARAGIDGFERLDVPTLLIRGRVSAPWLRGVVDVLAAGLPKATVFELDGGHAGLVEHPEDFLAALDAHLSA